MRPATTNYEVLRCARRGPRPAFRYSVHPAANPGTPAWFEGSIRMSSTPSPSDSPADNLTVLFRKIESGDEEAAHQLLPLVYGELRKLAAAKMAHERPGQTLQPTALVHDAWLRLGGDEQPRWENRAHFFGAAAEAMRRILIDNARRKQRNKHGGGLQRMNWENLDVAMTTDADTLLAVDTALEQLAGHDPIGARLIELRFFDGLSNVEAARVIGLSERTAKRTWAYARAWLQKELTKDS
jgi:RNA polymerase sigma factor (TIGR02999 family)